MNILVTGGNGQLGRSLDKAAKDFPQYKLLFTDMPEADITDSNCIGSLANRYDAGLIINCAAYTAVDKAESDEQTAHRINAFGPEVLAGIAKERNIPLIHISTDYVFDGQNCRPLKEDDATCPAGAYGRTKLAGEKAVEASGCNAAVIRTAWLYSEFGNNFVKTMLRVATERNSLRVVYDQVGTPTYAPDLAHAILTLAKKEINGFNLYHYSNEGAISWYDFAKAIFELSGTEIPVEAVGSDLYPTPARRPAYSVLAKDRIKAAGVAVPYWKDSLKECLKALKEISNK